MKEDKKEKETSTKKKEVIDKKENSVEIKEVIVEKKSGFNYAEVIVIMIISLIIGGIVGSFLNSMSKGTKTVTKIVNNSDVPEGFDEFLETYDNIINNYYKDVDSKELIEAGINGMLEYLGDDYSVYMNQETTENFNEQVNGEYQGIGVEIAWQENGGVKVNKVFDNSPAAKAGLKIGDVFVSINDEDVSKSNALEVANLIKKSNSDTVKIVINRDNKDLEFKLKLERVDIESVETKIYNANNKKIGYIRLSIFASNSYEQFSKKLKELEKENIDNLIIDVRSNSGGYLSSVTDIASMFLGKNKVIYQLDTKGVVEQVFSKTKESRNYKVVVLIDAASASASEILAAAMQESYGATVIGTNSYGKGTVQAAYQLKSGSTVKYTIQKWLTPNGNWINEVGVTPDIKVELTEEYAKNPSDETDSQLKKALEELSK